MVRVEAEIVIAKSVHEVFALLSDLTNDPKWHTDIKEAARISQGPPAVGDKYRWVWKYPPDPGPTEADVEVTEFVPDQRVGLKAVTPGLVQKMNYRLEEAEPGMTRVIREVILEQEGMPPEVAEMVRPHVEDRVGLHMIQLKELLEDG